jgi:bifunctional non-homologous end joining protein LigD
VTERQQVRVAGRTLAVSNLDRVLYPASGTTKAEVLRYYLEVAEVLLPHLAGRPVTFRRFPDGVDAEGFFQKRCPPHRPDWMATLAVARSDPDEAIEHCALDDAAGLAWAANLAAIELHVPMGRSPDLDRPTAVVFDLDPGPGTGLLECAWLAVRIRDVLATLELRCVVKASGGKGLQVYLPVDPAVTTFDDSRAFAQTLARGLEGQHPDRVVTTQRRAAREGKILIDWTQNHRIKTTVCAYSLRAGSRPTVAAPLRWEEVELARDTGASDDLVFAPTSMPARIDELGDTFAAALEATQRLPTLREARGE